MKKHLLGILTLAVLVVILFFVVNTSVPDEAGIRRLLSSQVSVVVKPKVDVIFVDPKSPEDIVPVRCDRVKPVTYTKAVSLSTLPSEKRKKKFIDLLLPSILIVNYEISYTRENLLRILDKLRKGFRLTKEEIRFVESILDRCRSDSIQDALVKANPVPPSLIIAQAAIESGWGTSRFFVEGNNPFGIWTFKNSEDSIRALQGSAYLRRFKTILDAVREYVYNVNVGWAYGRFRKHRLKTHNPITLSEFLDFYSIEREIYVEKIRSVIKENGLERLDLCSLDPSYLK